MTDPFDVPLNCPYCRAKLVYERAEGEIHLYTCERTGCLHCRLTGGCGC